MKKYLLFCCALLCAISLAFAQERVVSGKVTSVDDGSGIPGVNVILKGSTAGTVTDIDGNFKVNIPSDGGTLIFSFIGMITQEIEIGVRSVIDLAMVTEVSELMEVVVLGYSTQTRQSIISSVAVIKADKLENVVLPDINQMIQGNAPGVYVTANSGQPGGQARVRIRGVGSITASRGPLYVIDGIIVEMGDFTQEGSSYNDQDILSNLNPNDIASLSVLKDATATSLYGSRAANGVIVITTKQGVPGRTNITYRSNFGVQLRNEGEFIMMNSDQVVDYEREILAATYTGAINSATGLTWTAAEIIAEQDRLRPLSMKSVDTDWVDLAFNEGKSQKHEISASGGSDKTTFFVSAEYSEIDGILISSKFERYSMRLNLKHQASDKLDFGLNINPSYTDQVDAVNGNRFSSPLLAAFVNTPTQPTHQANGELYTGLESDFAPFLGDNFLYSAPRNLVVNNNFRMLNQFTIGYQVFDNLRIQQKANFDFISVKERENQEPTTNDGFSDGGALENSYNENINYTLQTIISGNKSINDVHNISGLVAYEYQKNFFEEFEADGAGVANGKLKTLQSFANPQDADGSRSEYAFISYLSQLNYNYNNKYYFTGSFRRDGSSRFGANNKWANFWALGGSWRFTEESFTSGLGFLSDGKLRVSYGTSGNADIGNFASLALFSFAGAYNGNPGSNPSQIANPDLTWEQSQAFNIALDVSVLDNRLSATVEYYNRKTVDMLQNVPVSSTSGFTTAIRNVGEMENVGWEISLSSENFNGDFTWYTDFNIAINNNKVLKLNDGADIPSGSQIIREGEPVRSIFRRDWAGVDPATGTPLWFNDDGTTTGVYNSAPEKIVGNATPRITGGFTNNFAFKGLTLSVFFTFTQDIDLYNSSRRFIESDGQRFGWNHLAVAADRWRNPGDIATRPEARLGGNSQANSNSSRFVEDASYIRLRNVTLGYTLPVSLLENIGITKVRFYLMGQNLLTITDYTGFDPEAEIDGSEFFRYPVGKSYTAGIEIGF